MTFNDILTAITTLGFPIVACIYMAYIYNHINAKLFDVVEKNTEALAEIKEEMHHVARSIMTNSEGEEKL